METVKLEMSFGDALEKTFKLRLEDPKEDLDSFQIQEAMTNIITQNIFDSNGENLTTAKGARLITTSIQEMEF